LPTGPLDHPAYVPAMPTVSAAIRASLADQTGQAVPLLVDLVPLAIGRGIEKDADCVFITRMEQGVPHCGLVVGASLMVGIGASDYLRQYLEQDEAEVLGIINWLIDEIEDLADDNDLHLLPLVGDDIRWRSFRGERLPTCEEILGRMRRDLN
jgi:hypothetical protein